MKPGTAFQRLVQTVELALSGRPGVTVEASVYLKDRTGKPREHDILIRAAFGVHEVLTSVECKDHARKIGVPDVEAFAKKCERTGVHCGVIVSASGFTSTAMAAAREMNIRCQLLDSCEGFDWTGGLLCRSVKRTIHAILAHFSPALGLTPPVTYLSSSGDPIAEEGFIKQVHEALNCYGNPDASQPHQVQEQFFWPNHGLTLVDAGGKRCQPELLDLLVVHSSEFALVPITYRKYSGGSVDGELAVASFGDRSKLNIVATPGENGSMNLAAMPEDPNDSGWKFRTIRTGSQTQLVTQWGTIPSGGAQGVLSPQNVTQSGRVASKPEATYKPSEPQGDAVPEGDEPS